MLKISEYEFIRFLINFQKISKNLAFKIHILKKIRQKPLRLLQFNGGEVTNK